MSGLEHFRERLDQLDERIARLLGERFDVCREIAHYKRAHDIPMMQPARVEQVRARYLARGAEARLPPDFTAALFELLIGATCKLEDELMAVADAPPVGGMPAGGLSAVAAALAAAREVAPERSEAR
ncbi:MAG TPA: chorismate mutase [Solirubrobacteraceae bacterium]|jgi:chorismate mutase-like protein|nr:chorismate mutase [Solirubrobacteraceae bacterium]